MSPPSSGAFERLNRSVLKTAFHRLLFQNRLLARALGFRMPPLDASADFGTHYADLTTVLLYRSIVSTVRSRSVQHAHEIGVGMFATLAIAIARRFPALRLTTSSIDADEVESAVRTARANGIELACTRSDVLEQVHGEFDLIWWNLPYYAPGVVEAVDRLCHQVEERNLLRAGGEIQLGFNTVPLAREDVEAVVERRPGLRVRHARTYWYNPHCILTITSR